MFVNLFIAPEIKLIAECSSVHEPFNKFVVFVHSRTLLAKLPSNLIILEAIEPILLNALIIVLNVLPNELIANLTILIAFDTIEITNWHASCTLFLIFGISTIFQLSDLIELLIIPEKFILKLVKTI